MKRATLGIFFAVFAWQVYRAATAAVTPQEALTYNEYASKPALGILSAPYSPANQILHSLLCSLVFRVFRVTEFSLRISSLLGFLFYVWAARRLISPSTWGGFIALALCIVNPFTVGWVPESTGIWMASGFFLLALKNLVEFSGASRQLARGSLYLGLACSFCSAFILPAVALLFVFLHFEFWGPRRVSATAALNRLFLPGGLLLFSVWIIPFLNLSAGALVWPRLLEMDWIAMLPGLAAVALVTRKKTSMGVVAALLIALTALPLLKIAWVPDRFDAGPGSALPAIARALRNELRKGPPRPVQVSASPDLVQPMEFYRRRYALGAVRKIVVIGLSDNADYQVALDAHPASAPLLRRGRISLIRNAAP